MKIHREPISPVQIKTQKYTGNFLYLSMNL